jgi:hypothetical protein
VYDMVIKNLLEIRWVFFSDKMPLNFKPQKEEN